MWPPRLMPQSAPLFVIQIDGFSPPPGQIGVVFHGPFGALATVSVGDWMWQLLLQPHPAAVGAPAAVPAAPNWTQHRDHSTNQHPISIGAK